MVSFLQGDLFVEFVMSENDFIIDDVNEDIGVNIEVDKDVDII